MGDNKRTVNTSTTPHISNQLGTENVCETLLCWFIIMIWALVCDNMYRYGRHFGSFCRNHGAIYACTWTSVPQTSNFRDGFRLPGSTRRIFFVEIQHEIILAPMCLCQRKMWKSNVINRWRPSQKRRAAGYDRQHVISRRLRVLPTCPEWLRLSPGLPSPAEAGLWQLTQGSRYGSHHSRSLETSWWIGNKNCQILHRAHSELCYM